MVESMKEPPSVGDLKLKRAFIAAKFQTAFTLAEWRRLCSGCRAIDDATNGGLAQNGINELFGVSGAGKTQFCLQLCLTVQLPEEVNGLGRGAVYICTEDAFSIKRLRQLTTSFKKKHSSLCIHFEDNIYIRHVGDSEQLRRCLSTYLLPLLRNVNIGLLVIDSIAALFRGDGVETDYNSRSRELVEIAAKLNELAEEFGLCVLCTNQVSDNFQTQDCEPCLGLTWGNLVTSRFALKRKAMNRRREFAVVFAPDLPCRRASLVITENGLEDCF